MGVYSFRPAKVLKMAAIQDGRQNDDLYRIEFNLCLISYKFSNVDMSIHLVCALVIKAF